MKKNNIPETKNDLINDEIIKVVKATYVKNIENNLNSFSTDDFIFYLKVLNSFDKYKKGRNPTKVKLIIDWLAFEVYIDEFMVGEKTANDLRLVNKKNKKNKI